MHSGSEFTSGATPPVVVAPALFPDRLPMVGSLDPAAALAFRTPLLEHILSADGKAAGVLTLLGIMFTVLARLGSAVGDLIAEPGKLKFLVVPLLIVFAGLALGTVFQAFRTIAPRFPKAPPSLAFFGDIARLTREQYIAAIEALDPRAAIEQMLNYNHTSSMICVEKSRQLKIALQLFKWVAFVWLALLMILSYRVFK